MKYRVFGVYYRLLILFKFISKTMRLPQHLHTYLLAIFCCITIITKAQTLPDSIQKCEDVRKWIKQNLYSPKFKKLNYAKARKYMYAYIDNYDDSLACVYSGLKVFHRYGFESTDSIGSLNCEHIVPKYNLPYHDDVYFYDIHNLYPVNKRWNSTRKNYPFKDIDDNITTKWMIKDTFQRNIPTINIDEYSEYAPKRFEPREDYKGNIARSILYFYTIYEFYIDSLETVSDMSTLKRWHEQDPPDDRERERNNRIERYQGNRNPYIDHPGWVYRAWYCSLVITATDETEERHIEIYPNPVSDNLWINIDFNKNEKYKILIFNVLGKMMFSKKDMTENSSVSLYNLPKGMYFIYIYTEGNNLLIKKSSFIKI